MREGQFTACATCAVAFLETIRQNYCPGNPKGHIKPKLSWDMPEAMKHCIMMRIPQLTTCATCALHLLDTAIYNQKSVLHFLPTSQLL